VYAVSKADLAIFSLGRLPTAATPRARAQKTADRLRETLNGQRMPFGQAGRAMGLPPNSLRYAAATGTVSLRWDGARQAVVWTVPPPEMDPLDARLELARRYLHIFGPGTAASFSKWAGIASADARAAFERLEKTMIPVRTPAGDSWILAEDESAFRAKPSAPAIARLLPAGDAFYLAWNSDRELLVPDARFRAGLWTTRVWPGALLVGGEIAGVWHRSGPGVSIGAWRSFSRSERDAIEEEVSSLPLGCGTRPPEMRWER
jgi:hypothetical protein